MLLPAFIFGLVSSLHCIGMCGPIAMMLPLERDNQAKKVTQIMTYHLGRITSYGLIGLIFGIMGRAFFLAGLQQKLSIFAGVAMIAVVLLSEKTFAAHNFSKPIFAMVSKIRNALGKRLKSKSYRSLYTLGMLNGFLPCGMVYVALFGAIAVQDVVLGILFMVAFGLGTVPMMSMVIFFREWITASFRNKIRKAVPVAAIAIGILFILRGLDLGIPYVSPAQTSLFVQAQPTCH